jgi:hypothetical protein
VLQDLRDLGLSKWHHAEPPIDAGHEFMITLGRAGTMPRIDRLEAHRTIMRELGEVYARWAATGYADTPSLMPLARPPLRLRMRSKAGRALRWTR